MKFNELSPLRQIVCLAALSGVIPVPEHMQFADYVGGATRLYITDEPKDEHYYIRNTYTPVRPVTQNITFSNTGWRIEDTPAIRFSARSQVNDMSEANSPELGDRLNLTTELVLEGTVPEMLERVYKIIKSTKICFHPETVEWRLNIISKLMEAYETAMALDADTVQVLANGNAANKLIDTISYRALQLGVITTPLGLIAINCVNDVEGYGARVQEITYFPDMETYKKTMNASKIALIIDTSHHTKLIAKVKEISDIFNNGNGDSYTVTTTPLCTINLPKMLSESNELGESADDIQKWWNLILDEIILSAIVKNFGDKLDALFQALREAAVINITSYHEPGF